MLNCILGMVDKTKRALSILQQRQQNHSYRNDDTKIKPGKHQATPPTLSKTPTTLHLSPSAAAIADLLAATIRNTEEKIFEVRRKAEEAVQEVKMAVEVREMMPPT